MGRAWSNPPLVPPVGSYGPSLGLATLLGVSVVTSVVLAGITSLSVILLVLFDMIPLWPPQGGRVLTLRHASVNGPYR